VDDENSNCYIKLMCISPEWQIENRLARRNFASQNKITTQNGGGKNDEISLSYSVFLRNYLS
jgi:hypothetical protein